MYRCFIYRLINVSSRKIHPALLEVFHIRARINYLEIRKLFSIQGEKFLFPSPPLPVDLNSWSMSIDINKTSFPLPRIIESFTQSSKSFPLAV